MVPMSDRGERSEFEAALRAAVASHSAEAAWGTVGLPFVVVPEGYAVKSLEHLLDRPARRKADAHFTEGASFSRYVNDFGGEQTLVLASLEERRVTALLDYHAAGPEGDASWCGLRATLSLRLGPEWTAWTGGHNKPLTQLAFAEFLEEHAEQIVQPDAAAVLEVAKHLEAVKTVRFERGVSLGNGAVQLTYHEEIQGKGRGQVEVPEEFKLALTPFVHGAKSYAVRARLRYRIEDDRLTFRYVLHQPERILEDAFGAELEAIEKATGRTALFGKIDVGGTAVR